MRQTLTKFKNQVLTLLLTIAALMVGQSAWADELTVYDGTVTNGNVPAYTYYYHGYTRSQFIIPADELADMDGGTINSITFYTTSSNIPLTTSTADVYLKEVNYTTISAFELKANSSIVYQGTLSIVSNGTGGTLTITFSTPYTYHGGNLLIGIENTASASTKSANFYGQTVTAAALYAYGISNNLDDSYTANFIPKTSFGYTPSASIILRPENLIASELEYYSAKLGWTERGTATSWEICVNGDEDHLVGANSNPFTVTGLTAETDYSLRVRSVKGTEKSRWSKAVNFTTPEKTPRPTDVTLTGITHNSATFSWTENGTATAWQICLNNDESNLINANSNPYTIENLSTATDYTMKVRAVGSDENSAWSVGTNFRTTVVAETVGASWSDGFEGATCNWELINGDLTNAWTWGTATNNGGTHALYISNDGGTTNDYTNTSSTMVYATKLLSFADGKYEFSYGWKAKGENRWDYLRVALVPVTMPLTAGTSSPYNFYNTLPTGWIALDGGNQLTGVTTWQNKKIVVDNVAAGNYYLVFAWCNDGGFGDNPPAAIDNVSVNHINLSYEVENLAVSDIETNSPSISWTAGKATRWQVAYSTSVGFDESTTQTVIVNSATYTMTGLLPSSRYYVKVRAYNDGSNFGLWSEVADFFTVKTLPYEYGFENADEFESWSMVDCEYSDYYSTTGVNEEAKREGSNGFKFYYTSNPPQYLISPCLDGSAGVALSFYYKNFSDSYPETFKVGYSTTTKDVSEFTWGDEITADDENTWVKYENNFPVGTKYIAIQHTSHNQDYLFLDDFRFLVPSSCPMPRNLAASNITFTSADITWDADGMSKWNLRYKKTSDVSWTVVENLTEAACPLSSLYATAAYQVQVQAVDGADASNWSETLIFFTNKGLPYEFGFEDNGDLKNWKGVNCDVYASSDCHRNGAKSFCFEKTDNPPRYLISPILDGSNGILLSFYYRAKVYNETEYFKVGYSTTTDDVSAFTWGEDLSYEEVDWNQYANEFPIGTKYIAVQYTSDDKPGLYLDDFSFTAPACPKPYNLAASNETTSSATITWATTGSTGWKLQYKKVSDTDWTIVDNLMDPTYTFTNLIEGTKYNVQVQGKDGNNISNWSDVFSFSTVRNLPYSYGFEDADELNNWSMVNFYNYEINENAKHDGDNGFKFYDTTNPPQYLISPCLDGSAGVALSFYYKNYRDDHPETFKVGYSTTTNDISAFTWHDEITADDEYSWVKYEDEFPVGTKYIAFQHTSNNQWFLYVDDFSFTELPSCLMPQNLAVSNETLNSATISWDATGSTEWTLQYMKVSDTDWTTLNNITAATYTFNSLDASTKYKVRVQAVDGANTSKWSHELSFMTAKGLPYEYGFEDADEFSLWSMVNCYSSTGINNDTKREGSNGFKFYYTSNPPQYLISPCLDGSAGVALSFYYKNYSAPETFKVGYSTTTKDVSAFTWGDEITANDENTWVKYENNFPVGTKYIAIQHTSYDHYYLYLDDFSFTDFTNIKVNLELADNVDNSTLIIDNDGKAADVTLSGRTLQAGSWNTLCLPFNLSSAQIESIFGAGTLVKTLSSYANDGNTVTITFASVDEIEAGKPYIILLPEGASNMVNPVFSNVVIDNTMRDVAVTGATFKGTYGPTPLSADDKTKLFLANNKLWYPNADVTVKACRAYFELAAAVPELSNSAPNIVIDFGEETTGVSASLVNSEERIVNNELWYTLDGRKLSSKPTQKGVYIHGGKKHVIR